MRSARAPGSRRPVVRGWVGLLLACVLGCAHGPRPVEPVAPRPIDLEPRCLVIEGAPDPIDPPAAGTGPEAPGSAGGRVLGRDTSLGITVFAVSTPGAGLESVSWGFGPVEPENGFALELAAALLRAGDTTDEPDRFRTRTDALAGGRAVHVENGWIWLELRFAPDQREIAVARLMEWIRPHPADADVFASTRRSVALADLADGASAEAQAARAFERLYEPPPGAVRRSSVDGVELRRDWTPASLDAFMRSLFEIEGSVLLVSELEAGGGARSVDGLVDAALSGSSGVGSSAADEPLHEGASDATPARPPPLVVEPGTIYVVDRPGSPQVEILIGHPTVGPSDPDAPALEMLASLVGGNVGGRIFRDLRERQGLAYILNAFQQPEGRLVVTTRARVDRVPALIVGIEAHLRALSEIPLLDCEVRDLRRRMAGEEALLVDDPTALRTRLRAEVTWTGRPESSSTRAAGHADVDRQRLEAAARRFLAGAPLVVLVGDATLLERTLSTGLPDRTVAIFDAKLGEAD